MPSSLLITLGNSPMIIPEAVLGYHVPFDEVHVFTTDNPKLNEHIGKLEQDFLAHHPRLVFSITVTRGLEIPNSTESLRQFEESLMQWYIRRSSGGIPYVCISGGTKTIPSVMQKAARCFGARDIFHVIADGGPEENPKDYAGVQKLIASKRLQLISLGAEPGWVQLRQITPQNLFSDEIQDTVKPLFYRKEPCTGHPVTRNIQHVLDAVQRRVTQQEQPSYPFSSIFLLPPDIQHLLHQPVAVGQDRNWISALPKTDLHCHLGGFATSGDLLQLVRDAAQNPSILPGVRNISLPQSWPMPEQTISLEEYMAMGNNNGTKLLKDAGCLKKQVELLYAHLVGEGVVYAEIRCSPDNYTGPGRSAWEVLEDIRQIFQSCMDEGRKNSHTVRCHVNLLVIATRKREGDLSGISRHLALAITAAQRKRSEFSECKVVGVDLAGYEDPNTRPAYFANDFIGVHRSGLAVTAHAGENDDAESIWQAVHQLHARRIGHGLHLYQAPDLMRTMADRRIGVEMCPYANFQIRGFAPMQGKDGYLLEKYLRSGIPVTVNTDNIGISGASITENFLLLARMQPQLTRMDLLQLIRNGIETAFWDAEFKKSLLAEMENRVFESCLKHLAS